RRRGNELAPLAGHLEGPAQQSLGGGGAEGDDDARPDEGDLGVEPGAAGRDLRRVRLGVNAPLAARLPPEVLGDGRDVGAPEGGAGSARRPVEQLAGRAHERAAGPVLLIPRLLADQHRLRAGAPLAEDRLRPGPPQRAGAAAEGRRPRALERRVVRLRRPRRAGPRGSPRHRVRLPPRRPPQNPPWPPLSPPPPPP